MTAAYSPLKTNAESLSDSDVPARLITAAIKLYGEQGCQAVSARQIIKEANILNDAAIRYYFGNKQDLLRVCVKAVAAEAQPVIKQVFDDLHARKADSSKPAIGTRQVITALVSLFATLHQKNPAAVKLMARMIREEGPSGQQMQVEELGEFVWRFEDELAAVLPEKSAKALRLQTVLCIIVVINALVDQELFNTLPAEAAGRDDHPLTLNEMSAGFIDFLAVGISGAASI